MRKRRNGGLENDEVGDVMLENCAVLIEEEDAQHVRVERGSGKDKAWTRRVWQRPRVAQRRQELVV